MERRTYSGATLATLLSNNVSTSDMVINLLDGSTFPTPSDTNPSVIVLSRSTADEEKVLISSRTGNSLTVKQRGYDGTPTNAHLAGATVDHVLDATSVQDVNKTVYDTEIINWMGI